MIPASSVVPIRLALAGACVATALAAPPAAAAPSFALVSGRGPTSVPAGYNVAAISGNGRYVAYVVRPGGDVADGVDVSTASDTELYLKDLVTKREVKVAAGMCCHHDVTLSHDGRYLVFEDYAALVPGDKNKATDVHVYDTRTRRLSRMTDVRGGELAQGALAGAVTADGTKVVFSSYSDVFAKRSQQAPPCAIYSYDLRTRRTTYVAVAGVPVCPTTHEFAVSRDGRYLALTTMDPLVRGDGLASLDVYWVDTAKQRAVLVSEPRLAGNPEQDSRRPHIDGAGRLVTWLAYASKGAVPGNRVMLRDVQSGTLIPVHYGTLADATPDAQEPRLSANGRWLTFTESNLAVPLLDQVDHHAVWIRDLTKGIETTRRIEALASCTDHASCAHPASNGAVLSADGKAVAYLTNGTHDAGDTDHSFDVYVHRQ